MKIIGQNGNTGEHYERSLYPGDITLTETIYPCSAHEIQNQQEEMAQDQNNCSGLDITSTDANINDCFELQLELQRKFPETKNIGDMTITETAMAAQRNLHAFMDEYMEFMDALGGINDGVGNAAWKYWKKDYSKCKEMKISDLTEEDLLELKFEVVDMFHFFINAALMANMTGKELIDMYVTKNAENFERQKRGY